MMLLMSGAPLKFNREATVPIHSSTKYVPVASASIGEPVSDREGFIVLGLNPIQLSMQCYSVTTMHPHGKGTCSHTFRRSQ